MYKQIESLMLRAPFITILFFLSIIVAASSGLPKTTINADFEVFFGPNNPHLQVYHDIQDTYTRMDNVFLAIAPKDQKVFTPETLKIIQEITDDAWTFPYSSRVNSITNFQHTVAEDDELIVDDLVPDLANSTPQSLALAQAFAVNEPALLNKLISPTAHVTGINITFELPTENTSQANLSIVKTTRELIERYETKYPSIDIYYSGRVMNNNAFRDASLYDMTHLVPAAFVIAMICISLYLFAASGSIITVISGTFATLFVIIAAILTAQGIAAWLGIAITTPSANAPTMILTLAIADSIHILATFFQQMRSGMVKIDAMKESLRLNRQPVFLTSLTTMIGFLTMNFSDSPPFKDLGNVVAIGVIGAWLFSVLLLPALMLLLPVRVKQQKENQNQQKNRLAEFVIHRRTPLLIFTSLFILTSTAFLPKNVLNDVWAEYFNENTEQRINGNFIRSNLTSINSISFSLPSGEEGGISNPDYLKNLEAFSIWLLEQPEIIHVATYTDVIKRLNKTLHNDDPNWYKLPEQRDLASQYLLLYELSLPFGLSLSNMIDTARTSTRIIGTVKGSSSARVLAVQKRAQTWLQENAPANFYHEGTSGDLMFAHVGFTNIRSMLEGTFVALIIISIMLGFALRSFKFGLISLLLNLIPAGVAFGIWGIFVGQIGLGLSVVAGMTLGIVVDYTVHFLSKYLRAQREQGLNEPDAIRYAFNNVGTALIVTTIILSANFGVLAFSNFVMNSHMGLLTASTIIIALVADFFFLPPLLLFLTRKQKKTSQPATTNNQSHPEGSTNGLSNHLQTN
ncbi:hypothetical protein A9Q81_00980 [Gammaproteobacteria bacterium 42_54_T18]|nr:hypothetical protein A9Q81_00980 [Gammaproteobacteria bacterium 42_54_T18]